MQVTACLGAACVRKGPSVMSTLTASHVTDPMRQALLVPHRQVNAPVHPATEEQLACGKCLSFARVL